MPPWEQRDYLAWVSKVKRELATPVGWLESDVLHLWHDDLAKRQSLNRQQVLAASGSDPAVDLVASPQEAWRWRDPDCDAAKFLYSYFPAREEDSTELQPAATAGSTAT